MSDIVGAAHRTRRQRVEVAFTGLMTLLLIVVFGFMAIRVVSLSDLMWHSKGLLIVFLLMPPPLCFLLVRAYTQMIEDERVKALSDHWGRCVSEFLHSAELRQARDAAQVATAAHERQEAAAARPANDGAANKDPLLDAMRDFVVKRHPALADLFVSMRGALSAGPGDDTPELLDTKARQLARSEIRSAGLDRAAYDLPIIFFSFAYFAGVSLVLPFIESYVGQVAGLTTMPRTDIHVEALSVPLIVFQLGFLGGGAYAAFTLISRFLSRDIAPRLFLVSGVRLLLAPIAAFMLFLFAPEIMGAGHLQGRAVLMYVVAGGFPFALLIASAGRLLSRLNPRSGQQVRAGKQPTTEIDGIGIFTAQRLSEEGIEMIQHIAFCDAARLARRTRFADATVADWKDQGLLYLLTADCRLPFPPHAYESRQPASLYDLLAQRAGIRTTSALLRRVFLADTSIRRDHDRRRAEGLQVRPDIEAFFWELGLLGNGDDGKRQLEGLVFLFSHLCEDALAMDPGLWRLFGVEPRAVTPGPGIDGV